MRKIAAITWLTLKAAFRFRLFWILLLLLVGSVVGLPLLIKDDGTARGFTQILLAYTLSTITALLGFATLWISCGSLSKDIEECQMQMVAVKPIPRWQIWLGKWFGVLLMNAMLLAVAGASVYFLMQWRSHRLPAKEQEVLRREVLVARGSLKEKRTDESARIEAAFQEVLKNNPNAQLDHVALRKQIEEQVKASDQLVRPGYFRRWNIDFGARQFLLKNEPLFLRIKFFVAQTNLTGTYLGLWQIGPPDSQRVFRTAHESLAEKTFHEFVIPPNLLDDKGVLTIDFVNQNDTAVLFPLDDGMEVLFREGSFGLNFARGIGIIFCWLALLSAIGLAAGSLLSFPVASFFALAVLVLGLSSGTLNQALEEGSVMGVNHETGVADKMSPVDYVILPVFKVLLEVIKFVEAFSPVDSLSTGRSISWVQLARAFAQIVVVLGGLFALMGIVAFTRRELATAQSTS
jgi:hypothetical protein